MNVWDIVLPHRLFINQALRTASDELRAHIDTHKIEHEKAVDQCKADIEAAKAEKDKQFEKIKQEYIDKFSRDSIALGDFRSHTFDYVDQYWRKKYLLLEKKKTVAQSQLLFRHRTFLTNQIQLISDEIKILEQRKDALTQQAEIDDVIELIRMTGCCLQCDESDSAKTLLSKVNDVINQSNELSHDTRNALLRLRTLLQERAEYLPVIQYISWMIKQRINLRKELANERRGLRKEEELLTVQVSSINSELRSLEKTLLDQATYIRDYWATPIANISIKLSYTEKSRNNEDARWNENEERLNYLFDEISHMKSVKSNDNIRWDRLQNEIASAKEEKKSIQEDISRLKAEKRKLGEERDRWYGLRNTVFSLFKSNGIFLYPVDDGNNLDEIRVLERERVELTRKLAQIKSKYKIKADNILAEHELAEKAQIQKISVAKSKVQERLSKHHSAEQQLIRCKAHDKRPFFVALFSETAEVTRAKTILRGAESRLRESEAELNLLQEKLDTIRSSFDQRKSEVDNQCHRESNPYQRRIRDIDQGIEYLQKKRRR